MIAYNIEKDIYIYHREHLEMFGNLQNVCLTKLT